MIKSILRRSVGQEPLSSFHWWAQGAQTFWCPHGTSTTSGRRSMQITHLGRGCCTAASASGSPGTTTRTELPALLAQNGRGMGGNLIRSSRQPAALGGGGGRAVVPPSGVLLSQNPFLQHLGGNTIALEKAHGKSISPFAENIRMTGWVEVQSAILKRGTK